jgi:hypothetical protein
LHTRDPIGHRDRTPGGIGYDMRVGRSVGV